MKNITILTWISCQQLNPVLVQQIPALFHINMAEIKDSCFFKYFYLNLTSFHKITALK